MAVERFPVEAGHIMLFARAVGDANQIYYNEDYAGSTEPGGIIAPPTFVQSSAQFEEDYSLRPVIGEPWFGSAKEPTGGGGGTGLHAEQHYEYHRQLRPGDVLHARVSSGKTWEREGRRGGKLTFSETTIEYLDQNDELVITARRVGVRTERVVEQQ